MSEVMRWYDCGKRAPGGPFRAVVADNHAEDMHYFYMSALISQILLVDSQLEKRSHM